MRAILAGLVLGLGSAASAQMPAPRQDCATAPISLPPGFAAWPRTSEVAASSSEPGAAVLAVGTAARIMLRPTSSLRFAPLPERPGDPAGNGGILSFQVARAGTYRVGLSAGAWIEVVRDGKAIASSAHGHGPDCSGIRKIVDFALRPGRYLLQIADSAKPEITAMIVGPH